MRSLTAGIGLVFVPVLPVWPLFHACGAARHTTTQGRM